MVEKGCDGVVDGDLRRRLLLREEEEESVDRLLGSRKEPNDGPRALVDGAMLDCWWEARMVAPTP